MKKMLIIFLLPLVLLTPAPLRHFRVPLDSPVVSSASSSLDRRFRPTIAAELPVTFVTPPLLVPREY